MSQWLVWAGPRQKWIVTVLKYLQSQTFVVIDVDILDIQLCSQESSCWFVTVNELDWIQQKTIRSLAGFMMACYFLLSMLCEY